MSQRKAAKAAGLSKDQEKTARRVAAIPVVEFVAALRIGPLPCPDAPELRSELQWRSE